MRLRQNQIVIALFSFILTVQAFSQTTTTSANTLQAGTQLVVVDVVVTDNNGKPVHGLKAQNFHIAENKTERPVRSFDEHTGTQSVAPVPPLHLGPGIFTDYTPVPANSTLNILLIDALNTPMANQTFVRDQLKKYFQAADPHARIAIFGLTQHLILLQGFTSDPATLKAVLNGKLVAHASSLLPDPAGNGTSPENLSDQVEAASLGAPGADEIVANLRELEAQEAAQLSHLQLQYTLDAFNELAHYLINFPGRKNLLWLSGSFPIDVLPDATLKDPFLTVQNDDQEFRETTSLLSKAQVAVYPISARGLENDNLFAASTSGQRYATGNPKNFIQDLNKSNSDRIAQQTTMQQMAEATGGHAYYNNDLAAAVAKAFNDGANFYTLTYAPADHESDGKYREIQVSLTGLDAKGLHLSYRHGYYAEDSQHATRRNISNAQPSKTSPEGANTPRGNAYARSAMLRGAPAPQEVLFKVRVAPEIKGTELEVLPTNQPDPSIRFIGPFRRYGIDYVSLPQEFITTAQPDGHRTDQIEFLAFLYDVDGKLLNVSGRTFNLNMTPEDYNRFLHSTVNIHLDISVPTREDTYLRIAIHDVPSNRFGVVEIPSADVANLPVVAPPATPSTRSPNAPAASTKPNPPTSSPR
jgi:VWFA-related protein